MPFNIDPQTIQKLLFGGPQAAMMPQDQQAPPQPQAAPADGQPPRGAIAASIPQQAPPDSPGYSPTPPSFDDYQKQHGDVPMKAPPPAPHHGTLAKIMLGLGEALGNPLATRIGENDRRVGQENQEFERNKPALQYGANRAAYESDLGNLQKVAETRRANIDADLAQQNLPMQEQAEKRYHELEDAWVNKIVPPEQFDTYAQTQLAAMPPAIARMVQPHLASLKSLPQTGKGYKINMQDDMPVSIESYGQVFQPDKAGKFPEGVSPQAQQEFQSAGKAHQAKRGEKRADEAYVASTAAERAGTAFTRQQQATGQQAATKHLGDIRDAQNQLDLVNQLASSKSPTDQTSLAFKALGLDLPDGVHRINETELNAIRDQGSLPDRAYRKLLNWKSGDQFAPEILEDIKGTAKKISESKIKASNDKLEDLNRVYGYKTPGSDETGRMDRAAGGKPAGKGPKAGAVEDGYRFKGGDAGDPNNWEKVK